MSRRAYWRATCRHIGKCTAKVKHAGRFAGPCLLHGASHKQPRSGSGVKPMMAFDRKAALPIEDYALIGDCVTAALVGRDGSIDWLCWPRFDSGACFAALLGEPEHGRWLIAPADPKHRIERRYLDGSLVLATTFETSAGATLGC